MRRRSPEKASRSTSRERARAAAPSSAALVRTVARALTQASSLAAETTTARSRAVRTPSTSTIGTGPVSRHGPMP